MPTAFNFLGPLTNPGQPTYAAVGVADARMAPILAGVFAGRGRAAAVFRGDDGLDELTLATTSTVWWVRTGDVVEHQLDPERLGLTLAPTEALRGGDAAYNAGRSCVRCSPGRRGPVRDAVVLNAGAALAVAAGATTPGAPLPPCTPTCAPGWSGPRLPWTPGPPRIWCDRWVAATRA